MFNNLRVYLLNMTIFNEVKFIYYYLEYIWNVVKDPIDAHLAFDEDGLDLAFKYFLCSTLTMRLAGISQINSYINLFNDLLNSEHMLDADNLDTQLCRWLLDNQIVQHIFGPNLHVEVQYFYRDNSSYLYFINITDSYIWLNNIFRLSSRVIPYYPSLQWRTRFLMST